jgi:hypothetical protein
MISVADATNLVSEIENPVASLGQTSKTNTQSQGKSLQKQATSSGSASGTGSKNSVLESIDKLDEIFNSLAKLENYRFANVSQIFTLYPDDTSTPSLNTLLAENRF